jgi:ubiquinone/menaquinone biosynthesis C-methylase UbiE
METSAMPPIRSNWIARSYFWLAERLYYELAWFYDSASWMVSLGHWDAWRKWALEAPVGPRVLEVGFGTGELLLEMKRRQLQVVGVDYSPAMQRQARRKLQRRGLMSPLVRGASQALPFASGSFDTIVATFPAAYIFDPRTWQEAARLLPSGGRFVVVGICLAAYSRPWLPIARLLMGLPLEAILDACRQMAGAAQLDFQVEMRRQGSIVIPIIRAQKQSG